MALCFRASCDSQCHLTCLLAGWGQKYYFETAGREPSAVSHEFLVQSD